MMYWFKVFVIVISKFIMWKSYVDFNDEQGFFISLFIFYISFLYSYLYDFVRTFRKTSASGKYKNLVSKTGLIFTASILAISIFGLFDGLTISDSKIGLSKQYFGDFYSISLSWFFLIMTFCWLVIVFIESNDKELKLNKLLKKNPESSRKTLSEKTGG